MRYRALASDGDYQFGQGGVNFLVNSPACVAQAALTRLRLMEGEWFLDVNEGTPYATEILGKSAQPIYDQAIRARILGTPNVISILAYASSVSGRALTVTARIDTAFGQAPVTQIFGQVAI